MRIVFMGTPDFALPILDAIEAAGHEIVLVITQPDRAKGRGNELAAPPAKEWALAHDIPVFQPERIRHPSAVERVVDIDCDVCVVAAFGQILPREILEWPRHGCINVHASLLPRYRGAAPIQWAILNGDEETGVTIQQMAEGVDTGDILLQRETLIGPEETGGELFDRLAILGGEAVRDCLAMIEDGTIKPVPQNESLATHVGMIEKSLGRVEWRRSAVEIERYIRGLNPWPGTYTYLNGKSLKLWKAGVLSEEDALKLSEEVRESINVGNSEDRTEIVPGTVIASEGQRFIIRCKEGALALIELQLEGKRRMSVDDFLRGNRVEIGTRLG